MVADAAPSTFRSFPIPVPASFRPQVFVPRYAVPKAALAAEATTYGWDSVNCIRLPLVNQVLKDSAAYPKSLSMTLNADENWTIQTNYGAWQIAQGGSGSILMMKLPLTSATMTYGDSAVAFQNGYALISLKLRFVPQNPGRFTELGQNPVDIEKLIAEAEARTPDDPAVVVQRINYGGAVITEEQKALFSSSIMLLLNDNISSFAHVFAVVNLNQKAAQDQFYWLKPTYTSYAYFQGLDEQNSYFAVLNQTLGHSPEGLTNQVAASAIPEGMDASILVSTGMFMQQFVLPGITRAFTNADSETFKLANLDQAIVNTKTVKLDKVKVAASNYTPYMNTFRFQVVGDEVQINTKVSINISPGIDAFVDATYFYTMSLVEKPDGTMTLDMEPSGEPLVNSWYDVSSGIIVTQLIISIIGAVIGAVIGEAIEKVLVKVIVIALITIVAGVIAAIPSLVADVASKGAAEALPSIGPLIDDASAPVEWPKSSGFTLKSAELNGAFQLGGMLAATTDLAY